jgi:hypothetical protein
VLHHSSSSSSSTIWRYNPLWFWASSTLRLRHHTQWHNTVGSTPLDEWSARRRDLYLTNTQHSQQTNIHAPGRIRTRNPSRRAAADPRFRPLGHWDRQLSFSATEMRKESHVKPQFKYPTVNSTKIDRKITLHFLTGGIIFVTVKNLYTVYYTNAQTNEWHHEPALVVSSATMLLDNFLSFTEKALLRGGKAEPVILFNSRKSVPLFCISRSRHFCDATTSFAQNVILYKIYI